MAFKLAHFLRRISLSHEIVVIAFLLIFGFLGAGYFQLMTLSKEVAQLHEELSSTTATLEGTISDATTTLGDALRSTQANVQAQIGSVQSQVGSVTGTVSDLQKLSKTDPQLLAKYSKVYFLNENYAPARLVEIPPQYAYDETKHLQVIPEVLPRLTAMLDDAKAEGVTIYVDSAYRSFSTQEVLKEQYKFTYGAGTANSFSADQGYSEHQLGTTVDLITIGTGGGLIGFDQKPAYGWLLENAYRYGFILSYPKNNGYYAFEPWHWRFVGVKLATDLHNSNTFFYTMDQRTIDTYLLSLFD